MFRFICLLAVIGCALAGTVPQKLSSYLPDGRIVGGEPTTIEQFPYQVSLQRNGRHTCGGSLIRYNRVLTAAHCVVNAVASTMSVRVGSTYHNSGGTVASVTNITVHPLYTGATRGYDFAILRIDSLIGPSDSIRTIPVATIAPLQGTNVTVSGWGTTVQGASTLPEVLQVVTQQVVSRADCDRSYSPTRITETMLCAADTGKDSCQGDSGGPLVAYNEVVGVVSWGRGCAQAGYPGVYGNVATEFRWIFETANQV